jgi:hypothetical protein
MVIVTHPHVRAGLVHGMVSKSDAAFRQAVYEPKVVEDLELPGGFQLGLFSGGKGIDTHVFLRVARSGRNVSRGTEQRYPSRGKEHQSGQGPKVGRVLPACCHPGFQCDVGVLGIPLFTRSRPGAAKHFE